MAYLSTSETPTSVEYKEKWQLQFERSKACACGKGLAVACHTQRRVTRPLSPYISQPVFLHHYILHFCVPSSLFLTFLCSFIIEKQLVSSTALSYETNSKWSHVHVCQSVFDGGVANVALVFPGCLPRIVNSVCTSCLCPRSYFTREWNIPRELLYFLRYTTNLTHSVT